MVYLYKDWDDDDISMVNCDKMVTYCNKIWVLGLCCLLTGLKLATRMHVLQLYKIGMSASYAIPVFHFLV